MSPTGLAALTDGYDVLRLDPEYIGSCPCFSVRLPEGIYEGHCWRVCGQCDGCGVHFDGDRATAERMAALLTGIDWYGEWSVQEGLRR